MKSLPPRHSVLLDTNVALLYCAGLVGVAAISQHKRLCDVYDGQDFSLLNELIGKRRPIVFSPYILAETSNLLRQSRDPLRSQMAAVLKELVKRADERQRSAVEIVESAEYFRLGMSDSALLVVLRNEPSMTLVTVDFSLWYAAELSGLSALNFNHVRDRRPDFQ